MIPFDTLKQPIAIYLKYIALNWLPVCRILARRDSLWRPVVLAAAGRLPSL